MFTPLEVSRLAHALAAHSSARQAVIATNIAHADTPGYRARDVEPFAEHLRRLSTAADAPGARVLPVDAGEALAPNGNSVSIETEMVKAAEARHRFDMALAITRSVGAIIRTSLGR